MRPKYCFAKFCSFAKLSKKWQQSFAPLSFTASLQSHNLPSVKSDDCGSLEADECLQIVFSDRTEYAGLKRSHAESNQALEGTLFYDKNGNQVANSRVSLTRHDDDDNPSTLDVSVSILATLI